MATRRITPSFTYYRKLRNLYLIAVIFFLALLLGLALYAYMIDTTLTWLQSIVFVFACVYGALLLTIRQQLFTTNMLMHYYRMIEENLPTVKGNYSPYDATFDTRLKTLGFTLGIENVLYRIYYQVHPRTPYIKRTALTLVWLVVFNANERESPFFLERSEEDFQYIKTMIPSSQKILNEITLWFQQVDEWQQPQKAKFQQIINFVMSNRAVISIPCAVLPTQKTFYYLRPNKQFPNKYYYAAIKYIEAILEVND